MDEKVAFDIQPKGHYCHFWPKFGQMPKLGLPPVFSHHVTQFLIAFAGAGPLRRCSTRNRGDERNEVSRQSLESPECVDRRRRRRPRAVTGRFFSASRGAGRAEEIRLLGREGTERHSHISPRWNGPSGVVRP